jgi:TPR repeat protein
MVNYNVWLVASTNRCGILRVAYKDNSHMPGGFLPSDGSDFYLVVFDNAISNYGVCKANLKNSPEIYNKLLGNKTSPKPGNTPPQVGIDEYNNAIKAYKETDHESAILWYKKAAEKGNIDAMFNLGNMYFKNELPYNSSDITYDLIHNDNVTHKRYVESYKWYKAAADLGNEKGMYSVGVAYLEGYGVNIDVKEARKWFQKSLDNGCQEAKKALEIMDKN